MRISPSTNLPCLWDSLILPSNLKTKKILTRELSNFKRKLMRICRVGQVLDRAVAVATLFKAKDNVKIGPNKELSGKHQENLPLGNAL